MGRIQFRTLKITAILFLFQTLYSFCQTEETTESIGNSSLLCETDNDTIGQHLGCSCTFVGTMEKILKADCSKQWIGSNDTRLLPPRLNVSHHVKILDLSENQLTHVNMETFGSCESVEILQLNDNGMQLFEGLSCARLLSLDLSRNKLQNLTSLALANMVRLVELDLSFNELLFLEPNTFEPLKMLRRLNLGSNLLGMELFYMENYVLSLKNLDRLEELDLSNSSLPDFPEYLINGTTHLKKLKLRDNLIQLISNGVFEQMHELKTLDLSGNLFETLEPYQFVGLQKLQTLVVDKMITLKSIQEHAFAGLTSLHELSCQTNYHLTLIDPMAFRGDPETEAGDCNPKIVRLGDNDLRFIDYPLLSWKDIDILELHRNSWVCDCDLQWVSDFYKHKPKEAAILGDSYFSCYEPHIFAGVPVVAVNPEEMLCFSPVATVAGTIGIIVFGILLFSFCTVIVLNQMGMLPDWVRQYNIFGSGSSLPTYTRVNPKPSTKARRMVERGQALPDLHCYTTTTTNNSKSREPTADDLEWDNADIGRS
ncbi:Leucine-rich repeat neuronal protein 2 [Orchesella cincta]|uniref:Leucine-rich repeat neuronal protein 2 n=1 Tax=Orchesella cincta TaxID=48709 RepID=A0A1D2MPY1_ORCCI|nr:Leucine-rich repeat neuronal protein 2 [Orchesella cincta]